MQSKPLPATKRTVAYFAASLHKSVLVPPTTNGILAGPMRHLLPQFHLVPIVNKEFHGLIRQWSQALREPITPCILQHLLAVLRSEKWLRSKNAGSCIQLCPPQVPPCWIIHHLNRLNIQPYYLHGSWQHQLASDSSCGSNNEKPTTG